MADAEFPGGGPVTRLRVWDASVPLTRIVTGLRFAEGPLWHPVDHHLTFSDIPGNRISRLREDGAASSLVAPSNHANGNAYDPPFGRQTRGFGGRRPIPQPVNGVYRIDPDGALRLMADDFDMPNGLCLSPDERTIFVADTARRHIRSFGIAADGSWHGGKVWAEVPSEGLAAPDGLKCDSAGNLLCSGKGGVHVFDPRGTHVECIPVPELVANFTHGGADLKTLFIAASTSIYRARLTVPGLPAF